MSVRKRGEMRLFIKNFLLITILFHQTYCHPLYFPITSEQEINKNVSPIFTQKNTQFSMGGEIQEGYFNVKQVRTLNHLIPDTQARFRHRASLCFLARCADEQNLFSVEAACRLHAMTWWQNEYTNLLIRVFSVTGKPALSMTDAWVGLHLAGSKEIEKPPVSLRVGYFPYVVGRGISLGYADEGGIRYLGFELTYDPIESAYYTPGILLWGHLCPSLSYHLYYTLMSAPYEQFFNQKATHEPLLFKDRRDNKIEKWGKNLRRDALAASLEAHLENENWHLFAQPYMVYLQSTYALDEFQLPLSDSSFKIASYGCMVDVSYKKLEVNFELAGQWGKLLYYPVDNNSIVLGKGRGGLLEQQQDIFEAVVQATEESFTAPCYEENQQDIERSLQEPIDRCCPALRIQNTDGDTFIDNKTGKYLNTQELVTQVDQLFDEFSKGSASAFYQLQNILENTVTVQKPAQTPRYRPQKKTPLAGYMAVGDVRYQPIASTPFFVHAGVGYFSGDQHPLSLDEGDVGDVCQKKYKGFIPIKDNRYRGHFLKALGFMTLRTIERPAQRSIHFNDTSNLFFVGGGLEMFPLEQKEKMDLWTNIVWFWQPAYQRTYKLSPQGDTQLSCTKSDKFLGVELNASCQYVFFKGCTLLVRGAVFLPGQLYKDMHLFYSSYATTDGTFALVERTNDPTYAYHFRISYEF